MNSVEKFKKMFTKIDKLKIVEVQTEHRVGFRGIIVGNFYGQWFMFSNVPFICKEKMIEIIQEQHWNKKMICNISFGGEYDFSYKLEGGLIDGSYYFLYVKTAFNVLAYKMGQKYVLDSKFDNIRTAIKNNTTQNYIFENDNLEVKDWIYGREESEAHIVYIQEENTGLYAYVSFYGEIIYKVLLANGGVNDKICFAFISNWKKRKDYLLEICKESK